MTQESKLAVVMMKSLVWSPPKTAIWNQRGRKKMQRIPHSSRARLLAARGISLLLRIEPLAEKIWDADRICETHAPNREERGASAAHPPAMHGHRVQPESCANRYEELFWHHTILRSSAQIQRDARPCPKYTLKDGVKSHCFNDGKTYLLCMNAMHGRHIRDQTPMRWRNDFGGAAVRDLKRGW